MIKVEKGVPLPDPKNKGLVQVLRTMQVGDSFVVAEKSRSGMYSMAKAVGVRLTAASCGNGQVRFWRIE